MAKEYIEKWDVVSKLTDIENKCQKFKPFSEAEREMYRMICETEISIGKTSTADVVEVKHGRWEYLQDDEWRCSNCHTVFNTDGKWIPMTDNFCSECGADMRERRDDNAAD